jgi:hypothetical protein
MAMARPKPTHKKETQRVQISARLARRATIFARTYRDQELFQLVESLLERELIGHGFDPFATDKSGDAGSEGRHLE